MKVNQPLTIKQTEHPHTGEMLKEAALETLTDRNIDSSKVLMLVTENGANVVKAMRLIGEEAAVSAGEGGDFFEDEHHEGGEDNSTSEEEADDDREGEVDEEVFNFPRTTVPSGTCHAWHTLQLVIKKAFVANSWFGYLR